MKIFIDRFYFIAVYQADTGQTFSLIKPKIKWHIFCAILQTVTYNYYSQNQHQTSMKNSFKIYLAPLFFLGHQEVSAQPTNGPISAQPGIFTYFTPLASDMPSGSNMASKAIVLLNRGFPTAGTATGEWLKGADGTAFFIRTFLDNSPDPNTANKICMCLSGHQIANLFPDGMKPVIGTDQLIYSDIYMNYLGQAVVDAYGNSVSQATQFAKSYMSRAKLLEYINDDADDIALLMVDKRELPAAWIGMLGYDFENSNSSWTDNTFYTLAHPHYYPLRITDNETVTSVEANFVRLASASPYAGAPGGSGAPLLVRPATGNSPVVRGVITNGKDNLYFTDLNGYSYNYGFTSTATKISLLENAIRNHCWNKRDSAVIASSGSYRLSAARDNTSTTEAYSQDVSIDNASSLIATAASLYTETTDNIELTHLHGKRCTIAGFNLPIYHPTSNRPWQITIACNEINVNTDFGYSASGDAALNLSSVVIDTTRYSSSRRIDSATLMTVMNNYEAEGLMHIFPNPSSTGIFNIILSHSNTNEFYQLKVLSSDGRTVYTAKIKGGLQAVADIHQYASGTYFILVANDKGVIVFREAIVYAG